MISGIFLMFLLLLAIIGAHGLVKEIVKYTDEKLYKNKVHYCYVFVRQDITPEQQIVQSAHVTMDVGNKLNAVNNIHYCLIGVKNHSALEVVAANLALDNLEYTVFVEPDLNDEWTAICTNPIAFDSPARQSLRSYKRLKINPRKKKYIKNSKGN